MFYNFVYYVVFFLRFFLFFILKSIFYFLAFAYLNDSELLKHEVAYALGIQSN